MEDMVDDGSALATVQGAIGDFTRGLLSSHEADRD